MKGLIDHVEAGDQPFSSPELQPEAGPQGLILIRIGLMGQGVIERTIPTSDQQNLVRVFILHFEV